MGDTIYCGLNCVPANFISWNPSPPCDSIEVRWGLWEVRWGLWEVRWGLWEVYMRFVRFTRGHEGGVLKMGLTSL